MATPAPGTSQNLRHALNDENVTLAASGDAYFQNAINNFLTTVSGNNVSTGDIIAAAARLKTQIGAGQAFYDVISKTSDAVQQILARSMS